MYMHMHNNYKQKSDTFSLLHTLPVFFSVCYRLDIAPSSSKNEYPTQHSSKEKGKVFNGIACACKRISKLNIIKITQVCF